MKKNNSIVRISIKNDLAIFLILSLFHTLISTLYLVAGWEIEFWGMIFVVSLSISVVIMLAMRACLIVDTESKIITSKGFFKTKRLPFDKIKTVEIKKAFLGKAVSIIGDDGKCFDETHSMIFKENYIKPEDFVAYFASSDYDRELLLPNKKLEKKQGLTSKLALAAVAIFQLLILCGVFISELLNLPEYPIVDIKIYNFGLFWMILGILVVMLIGLLVKNRHHVITDFIFVVLFFAFAPICLIGAFATPEDYYVSATRDFAHYEETVAGKISYFPEEIEGGEVVAFSYYYKYYWDSVEEVYLEVKYSDEEFSRIYSQHADKTESYFGEGMEETNLGNKNEWLELDEIGGELQIAHAYLEKIIFDKETNTVIYYFLSSTDFMDLEWCYLIDKFDIDISDYADYIEETREKEN